MAKITLGNRPETFPMTVTVQLHEGGTGAVRLDVFYRTRTEFGGFIDTIMDEAGVQPAGQSEDDVKFSLRQAMEKTVDKNAEYIMKIAKGWDLERPFNLANVRQLCDEFPGAALDCIDGYRKACQEGRLGN